MCLCYLFCSKLHDNYSESKGRFFLQNESIGIDSRNESNRINSNREWECTSGCVMVVVTWRQYKMSTHTHIHVTLRTLSGVPRLLGARGRCNEVCLPPPRVFLGGGAKWRTRPQSKTLCNGVSMALRKQVGNRNSKRFVEIGCFWLIQQTLSYSNSNGVIYIAPPVGKPRVVSLSYSLFCSLGFFAPLAY